MKKIISIVTILFLALTFFFGEDVTEKFKSSKLVFKTDKILIKTEFDDDSENNDNSKIYRKITIKNIGSSPSIDINALISLDGIIYHYEAFSIEEYEIIKIENNNFTFKMPRLTKGAEINLEFWMENGNYDFKISATDNEQAIVFTNEENLRNYWFIIQLIIVIMMIPLSIYIYYIYKYKPIYEKNIELTNQNADLIDKNTILKEEKHDLELKLEEASQDESKNNIPADLANFLAKYEKHK